MKRIFKARKWIAAVGLFAACASAHASTITFASFSDLNANKWVYTSGNLTAVNDTATWTSFGPPNMLLNYSGPVTYNLTAAATGAPTFDGTFIKQVINGHMQFKNGSTTVLDIVFQGAIITGVPGSNSTSIPADTTIAGNVISYNADPSVLVGSFVGPFSFSIALTQIPGISISGSSLANFTATASGTFAADSLGGGAGPGTPPPRHFWGARRCSWESPAFVGCVGRYRTFNRLGTGDPSARC